MSVVNVLTVEGQVHEVIRAMLDATHDPRLQGGYAVRYGPSAGQRGAVVSIRVPGEEAAFERVFEPGATVGDLIEWVGSLPFSPPKDDGL